VKWQKEGPLTKRAVYSFRMKKLLIGMVLLGSYTFAEPMPEGSKQFQVLASYVEQTSGIVFECFPELDRPGVQVMCIGNMGDTHQTTPLLDRVLIEENGLEPQQDFWVKTSGSNRYERSYTFEDGGTLEAIFAPDDSNQLYVFYTP
jgi:hypothetical protein